MAQLLIVDDEPSVCWGLSKLAESMQHRAVTAASAEDALQAVEHIKPDLVFLDVRLPNMDGLSAVEHLRKKIGPVPIVIITAYGDLNTAVDAIRQGAFEYLVKPFDLDAAQGVIERALEVDVGRQTPAPASAVEVGGLVGQSPGMQKLFKNIALVAGFGTSVHVRGESGTGKELVARAIHRFSRRASQPFVAVNIASLSKSVVESELFGHVRGAFTGAAESRTGLLEQAHRGTIFLDEVADIPLDLQVKLLRVLEYGEVLPVGSSQAIPVDVRVISATHQDLSVGVAEGRFRHDLLFRLNAFEIEIPPLRERPEDIPLLAEHLLDVLSAANQMARPKLAEQTIAELRRRSWHGNVRELRNAIEHALVLARQGLITPDHLPPEAHPPGSPLAKDDQIAGLLREWIDRHWSDISSDGQAYEHFLSFVEPALLEAALDMNQGQLAGAARALGLHRMTLRKKIQQHRTPGAE
jgi:two-component system nitrogen regulation response regulator GlnG